VFESSRQNDRFTPTTLLVNSRQTRMAVVTSPLATATLSIVSATLHIVVVRIEIVTKTNLI